MAPDRAGLPAECSECRLTGRKRHLSCHRLRSQSLLDYRLGISHALGTIVARIGFQLELMLVCIAYHREMDSRHHYCRTGRLVLLLFRYGVSACPALVCGFSAYRGILHVVIVGVQLFNHPSMFIATRRKSRPTSTHHEIIHTCPRVHTTPVLSTIVNHNHTTFAKKELDHQKHSTTKQLQNQPRRSPNEAQTKPNKSKKQSSAGIRY